MRRDMEMKPSGLAWAFEVPAHWSVKKLGFVARLQSGESITADDIKDAGPHPVYGGNGLRGYADRFTHRGHYVLIGRQGALCGNINYGEGEFWASEHAVVATPRELMSVVWFGELLRAMNLNQYSLSAAQPGLAVDAIASLKIPVPPVAEQRTIADYLDRETGRVDALVAEKERLLGLLTEKRRALITRAVTRGLNPNTPLRDSGLPWLGLVPKHWEVKRLKHVTTKMEQGWSPQCDSFPAGEGEWGVLKAGCVNGPVLDENENKRLPDSETPIPELEIKPGDILMSRANTTELLGSCVYVEEVGPKLILCDKLYRFHPETDKITGSFLVHFLRTHPGRFVMERDASGASNSMQNIGQETVENLHIPVPPLAEQRAIVAHITIETAKLDKLRASAERTIALLKERRAALIAAAVTGRIAVLISPPDEGMAAMV